MLNVLDKTLDYYQEIFRFVVQSDEYQKYNYLLKKLLTPYRPDSPPVIDNIAEKAAPKEDAMTLVALAKLITVRVRKKFGFQLEGIADWDLDLEPLDIFFLLRGPQAAITIPVTDPQQRLRNAGIDPQRYNLNQLSFFIIAINPFSPKKELLRGIDLAFRRTIQPLKKGRPARAVAPHIEPCVRAESEWDRQPLDKVVPAHDLYPTLIIPVADPLRLFNCSEDDLLRLNMDRHHYFIVGIDPLSPKKELLQSIDLALRSHLQPQEKRRPKTVKIPRGEAFRLARLDSTFEEIGIKFGTTPSAAHKAFKRDFNDVYGKEYQPGFTNRNLVPIYQLQKTCGTCAAKISCKKLCPEMKAYVDQDNGSMKEQQKEHCKLETISAKNALRPVFR